MRLHHLSVQAFGPFPERVEVDFDVLSEAGLFLLTGATGAGKTSVLDAVCFALFGDVPGDRSSARRLRCDTAAEGVAPEVRLEVTLCGRRFRLVRSPQWTRPKRRGDGHTTEQARVLCEEWRDGTWHALSSRLDETGHLITGLLGMNLSQFCQVAMLPQGQFQGFLRARSDERHALLQRLFETDRFARIEQQVRDRARELGRSSAEHAGALDRLLSRIAEVSGGPTPPEWAESDDTVLVDSGAVAGWSAERLAAAEQADARMADELGAITRTRQALQGQVQAARTLGQLQARGRQAEAALAELEGAEADHAERLARLAAAQRAEPVLPLIQMAEAAAADLRQAQRDHASAIGTALQAVDSFHGDDALPLGDLADLGTGAGGDEALLLHALSAAAELTARADALRPRHREREQLRRQLVTIDAELAECAAADEVAAERLQTLPTIEAEVAATLEETRARAARAGEHDARVSVLTAARDAEKQLRAREEELSEVEKLRDTLRAGVLALKEHWLDVRESRITGIAAELAEALVAGADCPVCGSDHHPRPAARAAEAPTAESEREARARVDDAEVELHGVEARHRDVAAEVASLRGRVEAAGVPDVAQALDDAIRARDAARAAAEAVEHLRGRLGDLRRQLDEARQERSALDSRRAGLVATRAAAARRAAAIDEELGAVLGGTPFGTVDELVAAGREVAHAGAAVEQAAQALCAARSADEKAAAALASCLAEQGFVDAAQATAAALPAAARERLRTEVRAHDDAVAAARATLAEAGMAEALAAPTPELDALVADLADCERRWEHLCASADTASRRAERLRTLHAELLELEARWAPLRAEHDVATSLAALVEGKSDDNAWRIRLSAYVLAWRLGQVVAAANERLVRMTEGRYLLEHTGQRSRRETRGGLGLLVRDEWSGDARDPATLSGGESFQVSLALALGLADVVANEVGGTQLDTLFVDEGFGSLDAESLDGVLDTLDALREGGRVVGVVSHVAEMRTRIPTQLMVSKHRDGSSVRVVRGDG